MTRKIYGPLKEEECKGGSFLSTKEKHGKVVQSLLLFSTTKQWSVQDFMIQESSEEGQKGDCRVQWNYAPKDH